MPSSYSTNLLLELMADGENDGLWGDITNTNLEILGRAISGSTTVSLSGTTHTLTVTQGSLSDGHYSVLVLGGSPTGTNTITIDPNTVARIYFVKNDSGQAAVFTQGSGGNATIADGDIGIIYSDGGGTTAAVTDLTPGLMRNSENLSGLADAATALQNLGVTATASELNALDGATLDLSAVTATAAEVNVLDGMTASTSELNTLNGINTSGNSGLVPSGAILMWSGSIGTIPSGWNLCDGTNGTPDLRNRFVVGAGSSYSVDDTGGASSVTLSASQMPAHTHTFSDTTSAAGAHSHSFSGTTSTDGAHNHTYYWSGVSGSDNSPDVDNATSSGADSGPTSTAGAHNHTFSGTTSSVSDHTHSVSGTTSSAGSGSSHENRPPYYALAYIMKL